MFSAGSLARKEAGTKSDLDLFVIGDASEELRSRLSEYTLFGELIKINRELGFPPFSNDGEYLKIYSIDELMRRTGSPRDDSENLFTARMLLMLESEPLYASAAYQTYLQQILDNYFRDRKGKHSFKPLFLLNDILRYWRTLCLNYEQRRAEPLRPWRKKNINLKFSRMVTVFGTILPMVASPLDSADKLKPYCQLTALERLARGVDMLCDSFLSARWPAILDDYESFLSWKEDDDVEARLSEEAFKRATRAKAEALSTFLYDALTHVSINAEYRRYLVL